MHKVCVLLRSLAQGGAEKQALLLAHALQTEHRVRLVLLDAEPRHARHLDFIGEHGLEVEFLPAGALRKAWRLRSWLRHEEIDTLFCFLPSDTVLGAVVGRWAGVARIHGGLRNARLRPWKERALRLAHNHLLDSTISNSHAAAEHFARRGFDGRRLIVIPNAILLRPEPAPRGAAREVVILCASRFVPEKGLLEALQVFAGVRRENPEAAIRLRLAGSGPLEALLRARVRELDLAARVEILIDPPGVEALFEQADVYLSTSHFEGLSNSILEAMGAALPVVATDVGDNRFLVEEGVTGHLAPLGELDALTRRLSELVRSPELRRRMGAQGRRHVEERHGFETFRAAYQALLDEAPAPGS